MTRLVTLVALGLAIVSTLAEAKSKRIHVTAHVEKTTFIGDSENLQIGNQIITSVALRDKSGTKVGTGTGICTIVILEPETLEQCLLTATFAEGQIIFGGLVPLPKPGIVAQFGILGGTDKFRKAHGEATLAVISPELQDATFDLE